MVSTLFEIGRLDILKQIQSGELTPLTVYDAFRTNDLNRLPTAATLKPLQSEFEKWIAKKECSESHRLSLGQSLRHLTSTPAKSPTVSDLPSLLSGLREKMQGKHPRSFNLARAAAQAFAKTTAGKHSKLWQDISSIEVLKVTPQRRKHPVTLEELAQIITRMPTPYGAITWDMALTGMGPSEYWGDWETKPDRVVIHGTKRKGRRRVVPRLIGVIHAQGYYPAFRRALRDASDGQVRPYDLRRTYANWLESAGIPRTRRKMYLGHGAQDVTDLYERHEVDAYLIEDAHRLRVFLFGETEGPRIQLVEG